MELIDHLSSIYWEIGRSVEFLFVPIMFLANKSDLLEGRESLFDRKRFQLNKVHALVNKLGHLYFEVSALNGHNVNAAFTALTQECIAKKIYLNALRAQPVAKPFFSFWRKAAPVEMPPKTLVKPLDADWIQSHCLTIAEEGFSDLRYLEYPQEIPQSIEGYPRLSEPRSAASAARSASVQPITPVSVSVYTSSPVTVTKEYWYNENAITIEIPDEVKCPLTLCIMLDPVSAADGYMYERSAITKHFEGSNMSPITNLPLENKELRGARTMKAMIRRMFGDPQEVPILTLSSPII